MLEKGLRFVQERDEELENLKFQIQLLAQHPSDDSQDKIHKLLLDYNNHMYPHLQLQRQDFVEDGVEKFKRLKNAHKNLKDAKFSEEIKSDEEFKVSIGQ